MSQILSKLFSKRLCLPYNCYEVSHTWTPHCADAAFGMAFDVFTESLKMYATLYLASQILSKKYDWNSLRRTLFKILRSSTFLGMNAFTALYFMCINRRLSGKFYFLLCSHLPAFFSSLLSICVEEKCRRQTLAVYVLNIASETVFRTLADKGYVKAVENGEVFIFSVSVSILFYLSNTITFRHDFISKILRYTLDEHSTNEEQQCNGSPQSQSLLKSASNTLVKPFVIGFFAKYLMTTFTTPQTLLKQPSLIFSNLITVDNLKFASFLSSFKCIHKVTKFALEWINGGHRPWHSLITGFTAGFSMFICPHSSLALYLLWKSIESLYTVAVRNNLIKHSDFTISILYAIGTAQLFYCAIYEPKSMKRSYMKFLDKLTHEKLNLINRNILKSFGTSSSLGYDDDFPELNPQYTSREYKETVSLWLIA